MVNQQRDHIHAQFSTLKANHVILNSSQKYDLLTLMDIGLNDEFTLQTIKGM